MADIMPIWKDFHKELKGFILNKVRSTEDTDDILQEVFLKIIRHADKLDNATNLRQYLYGIVRNAVNDYFRYKKRLGSPAEISEQLVEETDDSLNIAIAECCVKPFIQELPADYREALLLTEFEQVPQKELAQRLNISYSGLKSRVQRGREKLKALILNCCLLESDKYGNITDKKNDNCNCP